jgi:hypothetical protein
VAACEQGFGGSYGSLNAAYDASAVADFLSVILARGCRAKNPDLFCRSHQRNPGFLARARHARGNDKAGMLQARAGGTW